MIYRGEMIIRRCFNDVPEINFIWDIDSYGITACSKERFLRWIDLGEPDDIAFRWPFEDCYKYSDADWGMISSLHNTDKSLWDNLERWRA